MTGMAAFRDCKWVFLLLGTLLGPAGSSRGQDSLPQQVIAAPALRYPTPESLTRIRDQRAFQYHDYRRNTAEPFPKWLQWLGRRWLKLVRHPVVDGYSGYFFMGIALLLLVYILFKSKAWTYLYPEKDTRLPAAYTVGEENIHEIIFDEAIADAREREDFRLVIRLLYLQTLKELSNKNLITWKPDRTNFNYVQETAGYPFHGLFLRLTHHFEYAWYGDFPVAETDASETQEVANTLYEHLNQLSHA